MKRGFKLDFVPEGSGGPAREGKRTPNGRRAAKDRHSPGRSPAQGRAGVAPVPAGAQDAIVQRSPAGHDTLRAGSPRAASDEVNILRDV